MKPLAIFGAMLVTCGVLGYLSWISRLRADELLLANGELRRKLVKLEQELSDSRIRKEREEPSEGPKDKTQTLQKGLSQKPVGQLGRVDFGPVYRDLFLKKKRAELEINIRPAFFALGLGEDSWKAYVDILVENEQLQMDAQELAIQNGLTNQQLEQLLLPLVEDLRAKLRTVLTPEQNSALIKVNRELPLLSLSSGYVGRLSYTEHPLTRDQVEGFYAILKTSAGQLRRTPEGVTIIPEAVFKSLETVLTKEQIYYISNIQAARQYDAELVKFRRERN